MLLADLQQQIRDAVITGDSTSLTTVVVGGVRPAKRLAIHLRHYEESLTAAVIGRFPATEWLIGTRRLDAAARAFVHAHAPTAPCIAEYGTGLPGFLATWPETAHLRYVPTFADLDWHLGRVAVSIDVASIGADHLARIGADKIQDMPVTLQPGTHYLHMRWALDTLITAYLADAAPDAWTLPAEEVHLEVRGARGTFRFSRLAPSDFVFRAALAGGETLGEAAVQALELNPAFDPGAALQTLVDERLITSVGLGTGDRS